LLYALGNSYSQISKHIEDIVYSSLQSMDSRVF